MRDLNPTTPATSQRGNCSLSEKEDQMTRIFKTYSDNERKVLDFASYCAVFTTLVLLLMHMWPSYIPVVQSNHFLYTAMLILLCISVSGTAYLFIRMLHHCAGSRDIRWFVRIVWLPLLLVLVWMAAVPYYLLLYRRIAKRSRSGVVTDDQIDAKSTGAGCPRSSV